MSNWALYLGICAALAAAYSLLGGLLEQLFGVDPSRMTPAQRNGRRGAAVPACAHLAVCAIGGLRLGEMAAERFAQTPALVLLMLAGVFLIGPMHMAALFVSVRHEGKGLSEAAGDLLGQAAKKGVLLIQTIACMLMLGGIEAWLPGLFLMQGILLSELLAPRIASEGHIRPAAFGGAMVAVAAACAGALGAVRMLDEDIWIALAALLMVCAGGMLLAAGCKSAVRLLDRESPLRKSNKGRNVLLSVLFAAACAALFFAELDLSIAVNVAAVLIGLISILLCGVWLRSIGRNWASMAVSALWLAAMCVLSWIF